MTEIKATVTLYDTETTDKWLFKSSINDPKQPHIVQLAWKTIELVIYPAVGHCNITQRPISEGNYILKPLENTYSAIAKEAEAIHGISFEKAKEEGEYPIIVINKFLRSLAISDVHACHNYDFDSRLIVRTLNTLNLTAPKACLEAKKICTMKSTTGLLKMPGFYNNYKWPKLIELHTYLFKKGFDGAHDAMVDVTALTNCFIELLKIGHLQL